MTGEIALLLGQDGLTNGAVYALLAIALVVVYATTRVVFIPQGEFVAYGALTMASLQAGRAPTLLWLLPAIGLLAATMESFSGRHTMRARDHLKAWALFALAPSLLAGACALLAPTRPGPFMQVLMTIAVGTALGPLIYRAVFQPVANASVLLLLILAVSVSFALSGLGLLFFGAEGVRTEPLSSGRVTLAGLTVTAQSIWMVVASAGLMTGLYLLFERTLIGKGLRATAVNRVGARLVGVSTETAGMISFTLAAAIGAISGILIAPIITVYYDSGFIIGLKGFVGAIIGGLVSYPIAALGAVLVGLLEAFSSFYSSAFKEVLVFTLIIPVLLWRSLTSVKVEGDEE